MRGAVQAYQQVTPAPQSQARPEPPIIELTVPDKAVGDVETFERLHELDSMFINDSVDAEYYINAGGSW